MRNVSFLKPSLATLVALTGIVISPIGCKEPIPQVQEAEDSLIGRSFSAESGHRIGARDYQIVPYSFFEMLISFDMGYEIRNPNDLRIIERKFVKGKETIEKYIEQELAVEARLTDVRGFEWRVLPEHDSSHQGYSEYIVKLTIQDLRDQKKRDCSALFYDKKGRDAFLERLRDLTLMECDPVVIVYGAAKKVEETYTVQRETIYGPLDFNRTEHRAKMQIHGVKLLSELDP